MQPGCRGIDLPTGGRSKDTTDVGEPPSGMPPSAGISTMTITTNLGLIKFDRWTNDTGQRGLTELIRESFDELKALTAGS